VPHLRSHWGARLRLLTAFGPLSSSSCIDSAWAVKCCLLCCCCCSLSKCHSVTLRRHQPSTNNHHCPGFGLQAREILAGGTRKTRSTVITELIVQYNKANKVSGNAITVDEAKAIQFLAKRSQPVLHEVKLAWSLEKVPYSAVTMKTLAAVFLDDTKELPVKPPNIWHQILKPAERKYVTFFRRSRLRFEAKVQDTLSKGKSPNTRAPGADYRDKDQEAVWRMSCLWEEAQPTLVRRCSEQRVGI
jgi:hypothetical protein